MNALDSSTTRLNSIIAPTLKSDSSSGLRAGKDIVIASMYPGILSKEISTELCCLSTFNTNPFAA
jgi:hypothetical protein